MGRLVCSSDSKTSPVSVVLMSLLLGHSMRPGCQPGRRDPAFFWAAEQSWPTVWEAADFGKLLLLMLSAVKTFFFLNNAILVPVKFSLPFFDEGFRQLQ